MLTLIIFGLRYHGRSSKMITTKRLAVPSRSPGPSGAEEEMGADNTTAGGMFGWLGRDAGES